MADDLRLQYLRMGADAYVKADMHDSMAVAATHYGLKDLHGRVAIALRSLGMLYHQVASHVPPEGK